MITEDDKKALSIIKKHIRHFKKDSDGVERISFSLFKDFLPNKEEFDFMLSWIKKVEKERKWKL